MQLPMIAVMPGMEHAEDTLGVPPLLEPRVLAQFCSAVQDYADGAGLHEQVAARLAQLRMRLENLRSVATLSRLAVLGHPDCVARLRDELHCIEVDFPGDPFAPACGDADAVEMEVADPRSDFAAVLDLLAGAAFVSKDDPSQRAAFTVGAIRAVESAISYPLAYAADAAAYLGEGSGELARVHAMSVIANATERLLKDDYDCDPQAPAAPRRLLEGLGRKWIAADPVTEMFRALSGPRLTGMLQAIAPDDARVGETVTLQLRAGCVAANDDEAFAKLLESLEIVFCPHQPAKLGERDGSELRVEIPANARSGPIALVRRGEDAAYADLLYLLERYACEYPRAWYHSVFSLVPINSWCYPVAFGPPRIEIAQAPVSAAITAFTQAGPVGEQNPAHVGEPVYIYYEVAPVGSDADVPLAINAANGTITRPARSGVIVYTPQATGKPSIELTWGALTESVAIPVEPALATGGAE
jgi:hypothetical protein